MESCYPGIHDLHGDEPKESSKAAQNKESSSKTSRLFRVNESKSDSFQKTKEDSRERRREKRVLFSRFVKKTKFR